MGKQGNATAAQLRRSLGIGDTVLDHIRRIKPLLQPRVPEMVEAFYAWLPELPEFDIFFLSDPVMLNHVKRQQLAYWNEFLAAQVDDAYAEQRRTVGQVHARIGLGPMAYLQAMRFTSDWLTDAIESTEGVTERAAVADSLRKLILFDTAIVLEAYASAMQHTTDELKRARRELESLLWTANDQTDLHEAMAGSSSVQDLGDRILGYLCRCLNAQVGALYVLDEGSLKLAASSAPKNSVPERWELGEGLVGRAAAEAKRIVLAQVPEDSLRVASGLSDGVPCHLAIVPLLHDGEVRGVVELGSLAVLPERELGFLDKVGGMIAQCIVTVQSRARVEELLAESQTQAEELETQQEELRQTNEELEEQTRLLEQERANVEARNHEIASARQDLQKQADELALASQYKSEFLASMSHELRTPLNSLLILAKLFGENREENLTDKQVEYARTIHSSGIELLALIDEILDLAKIESGKMAVEITDYAMTDLRSYVERTFGPMAKERGLEFTIELAPDLPRTIRTDAQRFQQVLKNLLSNAFKFTQHGEVAVNTRIATRGFSPEHPVLGSAEQVLAFSVRDTGIGIPDNKKQLIFEAFHQVDAGTRRQYGGTGLGLSISKEIARLLGGELTVASTLGEGSTFTFFVPAMYEAPAEASPALVETPLPDLRPTPLEARAVELPAEVVPDDRSQILPGDRVLLVIEDDLRFARILLDMARERGFRVVVAGDGASGLSLARELEPDAITLDIHLPDTSGWTVLDRLKNDPGTRHIPVHIVTVEEQSLRALEQGAVTALTKPVDLEKLKQAFDAISSVPDRRVKLLLVVQDDEVERNSIVELVSNADVTTIAVATAKEGLSALRRRDFDCVVLDLGLPDMSGFDLIDAIQERQRYRSLPIIVYTRRDLTTDEKRRLREAADTVVIKGARSPERLVAEIALFLHRVETKLPQSKQRMIRLAREHDETLAGKHVLIVDDDVRNIFALTSLLEGHGVRVTSAENGKDALSLLEDHGDEFSAVLMDIMMPAMDGYETTREIRKLPGLAAIPVIAITAKAMKGDRSKCIEAGANDYIAKPVDADQLLSLLRVWLYEARTAAESIED
jgi:CheY-like chemotaxis protein